MDQSDSEEPIEATTHSAGVQREQQRGPKTWKERLSEVAKDSDLQIEAIKHGASVAHGALEASGLTKSDKKTGKKKIKKFGVAKAALRPTKTIRQVVAGADLGNHISSVGKQAADKGYLSTDAQQETENDE